MATRVKEPALGSTARAPLGTAGDQVRVVGVVVSEDADRVQVARVRLANEGHASSGRSRRPRISSSLPATCNAGNWMSVVGQSSEITLYSPIPTHP